MAYVYSQPPLFLSDELQYDAGVLGGVLLHKPFLDAIGNPTGVYIIPMISSSYSLAACVTSFFVAFVAFKIGRRGTIILGCIVAVIGSVIQSSSYSVAQLIVGRICTVSSKILRVFGCADHGRGSQLVASQVLFLHIWQRLVSRLVIEGLPML